MQGQTIAYTYYPYGEEYTTTTQDTDKFGTYYRDSTTRWITRGTGIIRTGWRDF